MPTTDRKTTPRVRSGSGAYTQVSIRMLKEVHTRTHPGATLSAEVRAELDAELADEHEKDTL